MRVRAAEADWDRASAAIETCGLRIRALADADPQSFWIRGQTTKTNMCGRRLALILSTKASDALVAVW